MPKPRCPVCKTPMDKVRDGWEGAPWRYICRKASCHFAGSIYEGKMHK